ncbi:MAG: ABC transporter substrate-binding protein [Collinsella sp.]|nr:ABC transporter substrate-binding protein [Collinsella sp.]
MNDLMNRRSFLGLAGGAAAVAGLGLAGCSGNGDAPAGSAPSDAKVGGGVITAGSAYASTSYDPTSTSQALALGANWHVVEGLYGIDFHDYSTFPELAADDPKQIDDTTYEITIREGAKFSDGTAVTPDDVIESYKRCTVDGSFYLPMLAPFASIEKKDDTTLTIKTTVPNFSLIKERLSIIRVVPAASTVEDMTAKPIGSGPWMYDSITEASLDLSPNPEYNGKFAAKDKLHYDVLTDPTARITAQTEGTTLVMEMVTADAIEQLEAASCNVDTIQGFGTRFMLFNTQKAPWDNVKARQAVLYALNYEQMISNAFNGLASKASCYLPKEFPNYHEASVVYDTDVEKAKSLLSEAGVTPGPLELCITDNEQVVSMATQVKNDLDALGFEVTINKQTSANTYTYIDGGAQFDLLLAPGDPSCFGADPDLLMNWWYGNNAWMQKRARWVESPEWKELSELMAAALGQEGDEQQETWNKCFDLIAEQAVLYPVVQVQTVTGYWGDTPNGDGVSIKDFKGIGTTGMSFIGCATAKA